MRFVGNLTLNLHDCGGQEGFMKDYLSEQRHVRLQPLRGDGEDRAFVLTGLSVPRRCVAHGSTEQGHHLQQRVGDDLHFRCGFRQRRGAIHLHHLPSSVLARSLAAHG